MNTKLKGNIALSKAIAYYSSLGYHIFMPVGTCGGAIDLIVSLDGVMVQRIQCKYTEKLHSTSIKYPTNKIYQVDLRQIKERIDRIKGPRQVYNENSFDILFVSTPIGDFAFPWKEIIDMYGKPPLALSIGKRHAKYKLNLK